MAGPLHHPTREDEYSYVLEGRLGALLGDQEVVAGPGDLVFKPTLPALAARYGGTVDFEATAAIIQRHGLTF